MSIRASAPRTAHAPVDQVAFTYRARFVSTSARRRRAYSGSTRQLTAASHALAAWVATQRSYSSSGTTSAGSAGEVEQRDIRGSRPSPRGRLRRRSAERCPYPDHRGRDWCGILRGVAMPHGSAEPLPVASRTGRHRRPRRPTRGRGPDATPASARGRQAASAPTSDSALRPPNPHRSGVGDHRRTRGLRRRRGSVRHRSWGRPSAPEPMAPNRFDDIDLPLECSTASYGPPNDAALPVGGRTKQCFEHHRQLVVPAPRLPIRAGSRSRRGA